MRTRVKVSGLLSAGETRACVAAGADALAFGPEARPEARPDARTEGASWTAVAACPPGVTPVLCTARPDAAGIAAQSHEAGVAVVQLAAGTDPAVAVALRRSAPGLRLIQALRVADPAAAELARAYGRLVDALVLELPRRVVTVADLDAPAEPRTPDWRRCRQVVQASAAPVWLAGGLTPVSVGEAVEQVNPFGVDVGDGVRTAGRLDARKLSAFFHAVRAAKTG